MKSFIFNLLGYNLLPKGWQFVRYGEDYQKTDCWYNSQRGININDMYGGRGMCTRYYPHIHKGTILTVYSGWVRRIE